MLYYAIGFGQIALWLVAYFRGSRVSPRVTGGLQFQPEPDRRSLWKGSILVIAIAILLLGCALPLSEKIFPVRYPAEQLTTRYEALLQSAELSQNEVNILSEGIQSEGIVIQGWVLYPRFHAANEGEVGDTIKAFMPAYYPKVDFCLVGPYNHRIVIPHETVPKIFPNGADIVAIGCPEEVYFEALMVAVYDEQGKRIELLRRQPFPKIFTCPLSAP